MEREVVEQIELAMEDAMKKYDPSHDALHGKTILDGRTFSLTALTIVKRVRKTAMAIAETMTPQPDLVVVEVAALMHDMADKKYVTLEEGKTLYQHFLPLFESIRTTDGKDAVQILGQERLELIAKAVENVSWTTEKKLRASGGWSSWHSDCLELHCVQDADRLDAIGAFGKHMFSNASQSLL